MVKVKSSINTDVVKIDKSLEKKVKLSIFNILINCNKSRKDDDFTEKFKPIEEQFRKMIKYLYSEKNAIKVLRYKFPEENEGVPLEDKVESIDMKSSIELGPMHKRLHCHTLVKIQHHTKIYINIERLRKISNFFMKKVDQSINCLVRVTFIKSDSFKALQYVSHGKNFEEI